MKTSLKKFAVILGIFALLATGVALAGGNITTAYVKAASTTAPTSPTDGTPLNTVGTATGNDPGQPITRALVTLSGVGDIVGGRVNMWRFVRDAGWARDPAQDCVIADAGYPLGVGINGAAYTCPAMTYAVNGNLSRIDGTVSGLLQGDGGVGVAVLRIETTWH